MHLEILKIQTYNRYYFTLTTDDCSFFYTVFLAFRKAHKIPLKKSRINRFQRNPLKIDQLRPFNACSVVGFRCLFQQILINLIQPDSAVFGIEIILFQKVFRGFFFFDLFGYVPAEKVFGRGIADFFRAIV